jgi:hypothetical protein
MATRPRHTRLDEIANLDEQNAWLTSPAIEGASPLREPPELIDELYDDRLRQLIGSHEWPDFATFLRAYIEDAIFKPFETERRWWNITLPQGGAAVRINIWRQYSVEIDFRSDQTDGTVKAHGLIWLDKQLLEEALRSGLHLDPCFEVHETNLKGNVRSQVSLKIDGARLDQLANLFNSRLVLLAIRRLNLDLMRGGVLAFNWAQYHVPKLVSAIFAEDLSAQRSAASAAESPIRQTTELAKAFADAETVYERMVWLRKNQAGFVNPVKQYWHGRCAITGIEALSLLEACHIKPFSKSADDERLNPYNGLYLASHIHKAFDANLIGISPDGTVLLSESLSAPDREKMSLGDGLKIEMNEKHRPFLEYRYAEFQAAQKTAEG